MITLPLLAALLAAPAAPSAYALRWGVLAQMAGKDYIVVQDKIYAYGAYRVEWVQEGKILRFVYLEKKNSIPDCTLTLGGTGAITGECSFGKSQKMDAEMEVGVDGSATLVLLVNDWPLGKKKSKSARLSLTGEKDVFGYSIPMTRMDVVLASNPTIQYPRYARWIPGALAAIGHATPEPLPREAEPAPREAEPAQSSQPPL